MTQNRVKKTIANYFRHKPVEKAWLFGSFSRNEQKPDSDVDILISLSKDARLGFAFAGMVCDLEDLLHRPVDLVVEGNILPFAQESVNRDKELIYERTRS